MLEESEAECPECKTRFGVRVPTQVSVRAADSVLNRSGHGTKQTISHEETGPTTETEALQAVIDEMSTLDFWERFTSCQSLLPELSEDFDAIKQRLLTSGTAVAVKTSLGSDALN
jgi:hypothetical protein